MEKSFDIQLELSEISLLFNQFIVGLETKLASNKARVSINQNDLHFLSHIQGKIDNIAKSDISSLRTDVNRDKELLNDKLNEANLKCAHKDGQLNTITSVLHLCYTDYQTNNRADAMLAIEAAVKDADLNYET